VDEVVATKDVVATVTAMKVVTEAVVAVVVTRETVTREGAKVATDLVADMTIKTAVDTVGAVAAVALAAVLLVVVVATSAAVHDVTATTDDSQT